MANNRTQQTRRMAGLSILTALVIVLQLVSAFVRVGPFIFTLSLAPIIIGGALYGKKAGAWLGGVFGVVVLILCITNVDTGGGTLWNVNPFLTAAGWASAAVYGALSKKSSLGAVICAGVVAPVVNTGIFLIGLTVFFRPVLIDWAGIAGMNVTTYILVGMTGINFIVELVLNLVLSSVIERIINYRVKGVA